MNQYKPYPKHKPSGIQWLGDIPSHWEVKSFKRIWKKENRPVRDEDDVVTAFRDGMVTLRKNRREDGFTFAVQEFGYQGIRKNDLVIHGMDAFAGAIGVSDSDGKSSPVYQVCTPRDEANPYYYALLFREMSRNGYILSLARGIRERSTDFKYNEFGKLPLPLPPITEQHAIAAFLDRKTKEIDSFLETKKNLIAVLKEQKAAIINDAVTGKCHGEPVESMLIEQAPIRPAQGDNKTKPSGIEWLGDIPSHWEVKKLKRISYIKGRIGWQNLRANEFIDEGPFLITGMNFKEGKINWDEVYHISRKRYNEAPEIKLKINDVLMTKDGTIGKLLFIDYLPGDASLNSHLLLLRTIKNSYYPKFLYYSLNSSCFKIYIEFVKTGSIFYGISQESVENYKIPLPPLHEQHTIVAHIEKEMERIDYIIQQTEKEMELMKEYKQALISEAVTGKIRVE